MALPNLVFSVASEYDGKGLGKARKDVNSFDKTVKSLGRTLGATLSAAAVVSFGKASVKAFLADDKAAATLTKTLGNLNLAFEDQRVKAYIANLEATSGVLDSQLRPAMQSLLTTTGSVSKSQELLGLALDVAAGSGENLVTVSQDIAQAFVGNTRGLRKYNLGLTQTELKTATFADLQERLNKQFSGQNAAALDTYAGKISLIKVAYDNLQETVGKGLVDSFALLAGDTGIGKTTKAIDDLGKAIADTVYGIASIVAEIQRLDNGLSGGTIGRLIAWSIKYSPAGILRNLGAAQSIKPQPFSTPMTISGQSTQNSLSGVEKMRAQAEAEALKRAKALAASQKVQLANAKKLAYEAQKKLALEKASAVLNQANKLFDMDRIQLAAAAMNKQTEEDRVRIRLKTNILELEDAIAEGNIQGAARFAALITEDARLLGVLRANAFALSDVPNPFDAWMRSLEAALAALLAITNYVPPTTSKYTLSNPIANASLQQGLAAGSSLADALSGARYAGQGAAAWNAANPGNPAYIPKMAEGGIVTNATMALIGEAGPEAVIPLSKMGSMGGTYITVNVSGSVTTERDLVDAITQGIYNNQASGIPINYSTVY
jgi:hypothetical protein